MNATFNMRGLATALAQRFEVTNQAGLEITNFIFDRIKEEIKSGKQVRLHRFGTFEARERKAGVARNPVTGARIEVPARRVVSMTVSPVLKDYLAGRPERVRKGKNADAEV